MEENRTWNNQENVSINTVGFADCAPAIVQRFNTGINIWLERSHHGMVKKYVFPTLITMSKIVLQRICSIFLKLLCAFQVKKCGL